MKFKNEDKSLLKGKMTSQAGYKRQAALLDNEGKETLVELMKDGAICEVRERQILNNGAETITIKFYFQPG